MRKTVGGCVCPLCAPDKIVPEESDTKGEMKDRSTQGSPPFTDKELKKGFRKSNA
jgi:hypothetical protein